MIGRLMAWWRVVRGAGQRARREAARREAETLLSVTYEQEARLAALRTEIVARTRREHYGGSTHHQS